jgi:DNA modification methylase
LRRRWISIDVDPDYVRGSEARFANLQPELTTLRSGGVDGS